MFHESRRRVARLVPVLVLGILAAASACAAPMPRAPKEAFPKLYFGYAPAELRARLARPDSVDLSRACGNLNAPWGYRGPRGERMALRSFGRRHADRAFASALASSLLSDNTLDTAFKAMSGSAPCDEEAGKPVFLVRFYAGGRSTFALLNFEFGHVSFFDAEEPFGMVFMRASADSLWSALAGVLVDDPLLREPRPRTAPADLFARPDVFVDELPDVAYRAVPSYPPEAIAANVDGTIWTRVKVGADGIVHDAYVESGEALLRDAALDAVWQWRFKPARNKGEPVEVWVAVPVKFSLH